MSVEVDRHPADPARGREKKRPFEAIKLACCKPCNDELNRRFENSGREPARALLADGVQDLSPKDAHRARLWVLKTWVLDRGALAGRGATARSFEAVPAV
jgi:hypothetical protein